VLGAQAAGDEITTIEGLASEDGQMNRVQSGVQSARVAVRLLYAGM